MQLVILALRNVLVNSVLMLTVITGCNFSSLPGNCEKL